ncbi:cytochrome c [Massilia terrae]|uniref:Cytochrome c n=1 Tax=Massilia terrae TaxID=1811224 RepID=A0ABT2CYY2_9BURK|nr:cytochrome c [Massilia terrae]MCS0659188.1 cytochrome c [Massilia terrae]
MNKWVKRTSILLLGLVLLGIVMTVAGKVLGERKMMRQVAFTMPPLTVAPDASRIEQGRYLYATRGCAECHGGKGAGKVVIRDGGMFVVAPNLTGGANGVTGHYTVEDWVRTVRHGVKPDGRPVLIMPSADYNRMSDEDMAALVSYLQRMPAVAGEKARIEVPMPVTVLYGFDVIKDSAEQIDHQLPPPQALPQEASVAYGAYVANTCIGCHGPQLSGGKIPGGAPTWPAAANLTPGKGSAMARYPTPELFIAMMRSGHRPDGEVISAVMPFGSLGKMNETELRALHAYLRTVPARDSGGR